MTQVPGTLGQKAEKQVLHSDFYLRKPCRCIDLFELQGLVSFLGQMSTAVQFAANSCAVKTFKKKKSLTPSPNKNEISVGQRRTNAADSGLIHMAES